MAGGWWEQQTCARKKRYPTYAQAKEVLMVHRDRGDSPLLHVYRCKMGEHYHLGRATGQDARRILKRVEKQRRKDSWKCHCGAPVKIHDDLDGFSRGLCEDCDTVRCDADGDCREQHQNAHSQQPPESV